MTRLNLAARAGRWSAHNPKRAILGWLTFVLVAFLAGGAVGQNLMADADTGSGESRRAERAIAAAGFPEGAGEQVLVQSRTGRRATAPEVRAAIDDVAARLERTAHVRSVESPLSAGNEDQVSRDGRSALVTFEIPGEDAAAKRRVGASVAAVRAARTAHPRVRVEQFGAASADRALSKLFERDFRRAELLSVPITLLILVVAFGALVAAGIPLLLGLTAVAATLGLLSPVSQLFPVEESISSVVLLIGLAVGVDYSLFYLRRYLEERDAGRSPDAALEVAAATSGRAVLVSGLTVMVAMGGMFLAGSAVFASFAWGTILVVAVAMLGSLTVLPALLATLGRRGWLEKGRVPFVSRLRHRTRGQSRAWGAVVDSALRRPWTAAILTGGLLVALSVPALGMNAVQPGDAGLPRDLRVMQTYDRIQAAFPGNSAPAAVVVRAPDVTSAAVRRGIADLERHALATGRMSGPVEVSANPANTLAIVSIPLDGNGTDAVSEAALATLRDDVIPATIGKVAGVRADVTGLTAGSKDFNDVMTSHLPLVFAFVVVFAFVLLLVTFRSLVVPIKAIALNLLSVGAAYGTLVLVFQDGHGEALLGFESVGGITSWLPLFLFVVLFGLSMDYHVFIISRIREAVDRGSRTEVAIAQGLKSTAGVVTSAALVMVAVFAIFATLSTLEFKQMGVGLAVAILIDATLVRAILLPATMKLLGERNWYLPRRLGWLPGSPIGPVASSALHVARSQ